MEETRRVVAKVEWHPGELYPRVGFIVTNPYKHDREIDRDAVDDEGRGAP